MEELFAEARKRWKVIVLAMFFAFAMVEYSTLYVSTRAFGKPEVEGYMPLDGQEQRLSIDRSSGGTSRPSATSEFPVTVASGSSYSTLFGESDAPARSAPAREDVETTLFSSSTGTGILEHEIVPAETELFMRGGSAALVMPEPVSAVYADSGASLYIEYVELAARPESERTTAAVRQSIDASFDVSGTEPFRRAVHLYLEDVFFSHLVALHDHGPELFQYVDVVLEPSNEHTPMSKITGIAIELVSEEEADHPWTANGTTATWYLTDPEMPNGDNEWYSINRWDKAREGPVTGRFHRHDAVNVLLIQAVAVHGVRHAFQTLAQLLRLAQLRSGETVAVLSAMPLAITDYPQLAHRGLMIDTGRSYYTPRGIMTIIDGLARMKLNVLHWHLVDDQSFPVEIDKHPELAEHGAGWLGYVWDFTKLPSNGSYSRADILEIVQYAERRGVRVVPEIDLPGHAWSWTKGIPELEPNCPVIGFEKESAQTGLYKVRRPLDFTIPKTIEVVRDVLQQVSEMFPDPMLHIGADEVKSNCWMEDEALKQRARELGAAKGDKVSPDTLNAYFIAQVLRIIYGDDATEETRRKSIVMWDDALEEFGKKQPQSAYPNDFAIQFWKSYCCMEKVSYMSENHIHFIASPTDVYLDKGGAVDWQSDSASGVVKRFLKKDDGAKRPSQKMMIGGEAAAWMLTETTVYSEHYRNYGRTNLSFHHRVWQRMLMISELYWRAKDLENTGRRHGAAMCGLKTLVPQATGCEAPA